MIYTIVAIVLVFIALLVAKPKLNTATVFSNTKEEVLPNRRQHFRMKFRDTYCTIQPLITTTKNIAAILDIGVGGMKIETAENELERDSLLVIYFEINDENFILEGIVKRKRKVTSGLCQYGIKFINVTVSQQDKLYRNL